MKKILAILLAALMLAGCSKKNAAVPTGETAAPSVPAEIPAPATPVDCYVPGSVVEQQTGGAVRVYTPEADTYFKIAHAEHNLVRARTQFKLVQEDEDKMEEMQAIIRALVHKYTGK